MCRAKNSEIDVFRVSKVSSTRHWMEIMHWSDGAGEERARCAPLGVRISGALQVILDVLTVRPEAQNSNYNPIPRLLRNPKRARRKKGVVLARSTPSCRRARLPSGVQMVRCPHVDFNSLPRFAASCGS